MDRPNKRKLQECEEKVEELEAECEDAQEELHEAKYQYKRALQVWKDAVKRRNVAEDRKKALSTIIRAGRRVWQWKFAFVASCLLERVVGFWRGSKRPGVSKLIKFCFEVFFSSHKAQQGANA